ncbi:MAG: AI-2E family transporter, partial [Spirochaetes bacterium]|nr:AI-2E family transporter [Spirochaetota bacterium]
MQESKSKQKTFLHINFIKITFYLFVIGVIVFAFYAFLPLLGAVIVAFIIAYLINPVVDFFERKQIIRLIPITMIFILIILIIGLLAFAVKTSFPTQTEIAQMKQNVITSLEESKTYFNSKYDFFNWDDVFDPIMNSVNSGTNLTNQLPKLLSSLAGMSSLFLIIPFCIFVFLMNGR